jgi:hypothetical protein
MITESSAYFVREKRIVQRAKHVILVPSTSSARKQVAQSSTVRNPLTRPEVDNSLNQCQFCYSKFVCLLTSNADNNFVAAIVSLETTTLSFRLASADRKLDSARP